MAGMPWVRVYADLSGHPKIVALQDALDGDPFAWSYPVALWCWCATHAPTGEGTGRLGTPGVVERACRWQGDRGVLFAALVAAGLVDEIPGGWSVHDWADHAGAHLARFERDRERSRIKRAKERAAYALGVVPDAPYPDPQASEERPATVHGRSEGTTGGTSGGRSEGTTANGPGRVHGLGRFPRD